MLGFYIFLWVYIVLITFLEKFYNIFTIFLHTFTTLCNIQSGFFYLRAFPALQSCASILLSTRNSQTQLSLSICYFSTSARKVSPSQTEEQINNAGKDFANLDFPFSSTHEERLPTASVTMWDGRSFFSPGVFSTWWQDKEGFLFDIRGAALPKQINVWLCAQCRYSFCR